MSLEICGGDLVRLPLELPFRCGEALVVRREAATHIELLALKEQLLARVTRLVTRHPELRLRGPL